MAKNHCKLSAIAGQVFEIYLSRVGQNHQKLLFTVVEENFTIFLQAKWASNEDTRDQHCTSVF